MLWYRKQLSSVLLFSIQLHASQFQCAAPSLILLLIQIESKLKYWTQPANHRLVAMLCTAWRNSIEIKCKCVDRGRRMKNYWRANDSQLQKYACAWAHMWGVAYNVEWNYIGAIQCWFVQQQTYLIWVDRIKILSCLSTGTLIRANMHGIDLLRTRFRLMCCECRRWNSGFSSKDS